MLPGMTWLELQHKVMTSRPRQHRVTTDSQRAEQAHQAHQAQQAKQAQQAQHAQQAQILHKLYTDSPIESKLNTNSTRIEHTLNTQILKLHPN